MVRVLWISAGHFFETGYGNMNRDILNYLQDQGFDVYSMSNQITVGMSRGYIIVEGIKTIPMGKDAFYRDIMPSVIQKVKPDLTFSLWDVWIWYDIRTKINYWRMLKDQIGEDLVKWVPYVPIDAKLWKGSSIVKALEESYHMVAMARFGYDELSKFFKKSDITLIPHHIDTKVYYPKDYQEAVEDLNNFLKEKGALIKPIEEALPEDSFKLIFVGENISERKDIPRLLRAFKLFLDIVEQNYKTNKDIKLILRTNPEPVPGNSFDLISIIEKLDISKNIVIFGEKMPAQYLNDLYNISDIYVSASRGEGFGLPIVEAMATSKPAVLPGNSAHIEHVKDLQTGKETKGWLVKCDNESEVLWTESLQDYPVIDPLDFAMKLYKAYVDWKENNGKEIKEKGKNALEYAKSLDKEKILPKWKELINTLLQG